MSWKEMWNTAVNSRQIWAFPTNLTEHCLHHLDVLVLLGLMIILALIMFGYFQIIIRRERRKADREYKRWMHEWEKRGRRRNSAA